ncbi:MAG: Rieske (2Fe-2S) iron-sulfur domain protein [Actinomycetia bacterium]|nr:Rieske (2Fe-2S) iron-sulfur domain protein [Actinomycetes bacterium]
MTPNLGGWLPVATPDQLTGLGSSSSTGRSRPPRSASDSAMTGLTGPLAVRVHDVPWALVRLDGVLAAFLDRCPHRRVPLSSGRVVGSQLECPYHGWRFDASGRCALIPALAPSPPPKGMRAPRAAVTEAHGAIWLATAPTLPQPVLPPTAVLQHPRHFAVPAADLPLPSGLLHVPRPETATTTVLYSWSV